MNADKPITISTLYVNGSPLPPPREVQTVSAASFRLITTRAPPIDERSLIEVELSDGRRARVRVISIDRLGSAERPLFAVVAAVPPQG